MRFKVESLLNFDAVNVCDIANAGLLSLFHIQSDGDERDTSCAIAMSLCMWVKREISVLSSQR